MLPEQSDLGEQIAHRHADARGGGRETPLGDAHIGPAAQQLLRRADGVQGRQRRHRRRGDSCSLSAVGWRPVSTLRR